MADEQLDIDKRWEEMDPGAKARAMRNLHEEQQKLVVDVGRQIMEKQVDIAVAITKVRAMKEMNQPARAEEIMEQELRPREAELEDLKRLAGEGRALLDTYERMGRGIL